MMTIVQSPDQLPDDEFTKGMITSKIRAMTRSERNLSCLICVSSNTTSRLFPMTNLPKA